MVFSIYIRLLLLKLGIALLSKFKKVFSKKINAWSHEIGRHVPSYELKRIVMLQYQKKYDCKIFVETGTYKGETVNYVKNYFEEIYSIEIYEPLYKNALNMFINDNNVNLFLGDSSDVMPIIINKLDKKTLFWLDAHYSGQGTSMGSLECPIYAELDTIFKANVPFVILIDDARWFGGTNDYPTLHELYLYIYKKYPYAEINVKEDIIRIVV
jgi:hypothetical protein